MPNNYQKCTLLVGALGVVPAIVDGQTARDITVQLVGAFDIRARSITVLQELPGRRIVILDSAAGLVISVETTGMRTEILARLGTAATDLRRPIDLLLYKADSLLVVNGGGSRLGFTTGATIAWTEIPKRVMESSGPNSLARRFVARFADSSGAFYRSGLGFDLTNDRLRRLDSVPIERWRRNLDGADTVAFLALRSIKDSNRTADPRSSALGIDLPFHNGDTWAVSAAGHVAVIHHDPYRVTIVRRDGTRSVGPIVNIEEVPVTEFHKELYRSSRRHDPGWVEPSKWPERMPPFLSNAALFSRDTLLWLRRTAPSAQPTPYDLFDLHGNRLGTVSFDPETRVVGFGREYVYTARRSTADDYRIQAYLVQIPNHR
jgi:hypothetical protein